MLPLTLFAQQTVEGISPAYSFSITKEIKPPVLTFVNAAQPFTDANNNMAIDAGENCKINMTVKNSGLGDGYNLKALVTAIGATQGISFPTSLNLSVIKVGSQINFEIPVTAGMNTTDGSITFKIKVDEPNGFGTDDFELDVITRKFAAPMVEVVDNTITSGLGSVLKKKLPFDMQVLVQNTQQGIAEQVSITLQLPGGVLCLSGNEVSQIPVLKPGEQQLLTYSLIVSDQYAGGNSIPIKVLLSEKHKKYAQNKDLNLQMNQEFAVNKIKVDANITNNTVDIKKGSLGSDVDKNIPEGAAPNSHKYAIIIGNEDYSSFQTGLNTEVNVDFAVNDAVILKEYCTHMLGFKENQVKLLKNATSGQINQALAWLENLIKLENGNAEVMFYYSGHGLPDENTKEPYLIPVDVSGANLQQGIKLSHVYQSLTSHPAKKVTVLLDACFSGGARNMPLLAQKTIKIQPKAATIDGNLIVLASSSGDESSGVYREQQHGYFTYFLLKKL